MPPIREYTIKIEEKAKEDATNRLTKELIAMRKAVSTGRPTQKGVSSEEISRLLSQTIDALSRNQKDFKASIGKLIKTLEIKRGPTSYGKNVPDPSVELLGKQIASLSKNLKSLSTTKKVALVDIETGPIRKGGALGGKVDLITQVGVLVASLEDILTKTSKELEKQTKEIFIKPSKKLAATKAEYEKLMEPLTKKGIKAIPWEKLEKSGLEFKDAMNEFAKTIKNAELIVGHNIEQFDMKVLNAAFKSAGTKIELAAQEYYDTVIASRKQFPKRAEHKLESYEKDMVLAGKEYAGAVHTAKHDVLVTADVMKALAGKAEELEAAESNLSAVMSKLAKKIDGLFTKTDQLNLAFDHLNKEVLSTGKNLRSLEETVPIADESLTNLIKESDKAAKALSNYSKDAFIDIKEVSKIKSSIEAAVFKPSVVRPTAAGVPHVYRRGPQVPAGAGIPYKPDVANRMISDLAASLKKLQDNIVKSLQIGMRKGTEILKTEAGEFFKLGRGKREWEVKIVDVNKIKRELRESFGVVVDPELDTRGLVEAYEKVYTKREASYVRSTEETASAVHEWLRRYGKEEAAGKSEYIKKLYEEFKSKGDAIIGQLKEDPRLEDLYKSTALQEKAVQHITDQFAKVLTVPAATVTKQGTLALETKYGAERALANFATLTTGLERLIAEFKSLGGDVKEYAGYMSKVAAVPLRPGPEEKVESGKLAGTLMKRVGELGGKGILTEGYREAIKLRKLERGETEENIRVFDSLKMSFSELEAEAQRLNISSVDVADALNQIKFENFYDILNKLYTAGKVPYLEEKARRIMEMDRNLRDVAKIKDELLGIMPLVEPGRPKRREYEEQVVKIFTKAQEDLVPAEQKKHIADVALIWAEMAENARRLGKSGLYAEKEYLGIPEAKPIDLSDSASAQLTQFNKRFDSSLRSLNKTMISASTAAIRGLAPFEQFSSISRQMSYAANALAGGLEKVGKLEIPALVSGKEEQMIRGGRYGTGGYGVNVLTELRNTASTFEDQIVISGKLAKAFTEIVKPLVRPAAEIGAGEIGPIEPGHKRISGKGKRFLRTKLEEAEYNKLIDGVSDRIQEILGVPVRERGRADITRIGEEIQNVMRVHRGESIEVQTAKLTETFLNYFGRKLSTRFGTKGVSVTPTLAPTEIKQYQDIAKAMAAGLEAKVVPGAGLGLAKIPKSMGELLADLFSEADVAKIFDQRVLDSLVTSLEESGNKFIFDLFKDAEKGLVTKEEAEKQQGLFKETSNAFRRAFGEELPKEASEIIKLIRGRYEKEFGKGELFELRPIEARISARGIAKRGLAPEVMEGIINNLIGSTKGVTVLQDQINNTLVASEELNNYLKELGYRPLEDIEGMRKRLKLEGAKPGEIAELENFEKKWKVYTDSINEFGESVQAFIAPKFLQITEEPHIYKGWTEREISKGIKGERLNYQAFAAYAGIFGSGSSMLKELADATALTSEEGWELIRALQMIDPALRGFRESLMSGLREVPLRDIGQFEKRTATLKDLQETIFDIAKYPAPFKVKIPAGKKGAEKFYEELYVPSPALRGTYPEELMGGKVAPTNIARYLSNLVNAAKAVEDVYAAATGEGMALDDKSMNKFARTVRQELTSTLTKTYKEVASIESKQVVTPANIKLMESIINKLKPALEKPLAPGVYARPALKQGIAMPTMLEAIESYEQELRMARAPKMFTKVLGRIMDMIIGPQPEALGREEEKISTALKKYKEIGVVPTEYKTAYERYGMGGKIPFEDVMEKFRKTVEARREAPTVFDIELEAGNLREFAEKVGINLEITVKEALERAMESLGKAKIAYFQELAKSVIGPKHAIEQTFFQRTIPAITGKAIAAVTDKSEELHDLLKLFEGKKFDIKLDMPEIGVLKKSLEDIINKHEEYIAKSKKLGLPVLKEREIGLSPLMAKALKVKTGAGELSNLAELIEKREKMTKEELDQLRLSRDVFVESVRYPFYGTVSVQPHKARLMKEAEAKYAVTVPGAPELDLPGLSKIIDKLTEYVYGRSEEEKIVEPGLLQKREALWAEGTVRSAEKAAELTEEMEKLIGIIKKATPTFINMEQKLDYDGDALFVHTGQLEASRKEIEKHFNALGEDVTSVRSLFSTLFTAIKESEVKSLSEMAYIFRKKHPKEKGFEWLTKPYIEKEVKHLDVKEVMRALYTYTPAGGKMEPGAPEYEAKLGEWAGGFMEKEILPEVFRKLGIASEERAAYTGRVRAGGGLPPAEVGGLDKSIRDLTEQMIRRRLWEQKYSDAVVGQLYKLHTGQTVEAISRLVRMSEIETGFGRGLAKTGQAKFQPAAEFLQYWPEESAALGERPVQAFATRMNEIMRFVIQKGMDEKHAGVKAVGEDILSNVAKKGGARTIWKIMKEEEDQFDDLWDFNSQIIKEAQLRLGALPTSELKGELKRFQIGRMTYEDLKKEFETMGGEIAADAPRKIIADALIEAAKEADISKDREQIVNEIIGYIDLEAVFEELFRMIKRTAIKGLTKELQIEVSELSPERRARREAEISRAGGYERFAEKAIEEKAITPQGLSILRYVTANLQPLYAMRTRMQTPATLARRTRAQIEAPEMMLPEQGAEGLRRSYEQVLKTSRVLSRSMEGVIPGAKGGIHSLMVLGALEKRYKDLEKITEVAKRAEIPEGYGKELVEKKFPYLLGTAVSDVPKLMSDVWNESWKEAGAGTIVDSIDTWTKRMEEVKKAAAAKIEELAQIIAVPPITPEEEYKAYHEFLTRYPEAVKKLNQAVETMTRKTAKVPEEEIDEVIQYFTDQAKAFLRFQIGMSEQVRRVSEAMRVIPVQKRGLEMAFPGYETAVRKGPVELANEMAKREKEGFEGLKRHRIEEQENYQERIEEFWKRESLRKPGEVREIIETYKKPEIPMTAAAESLEREAVKAADEISEAVADAIIQRKRLALEALASKAAGGIEEKKEISLHELYRASGLYGGGAYSGVPQEEAISKQMLGTTEKSMLLETTGFRGGAIHRRKQKEFIEKYSEYGQVQTEGLIEDLDNMITGHYDVLYKTAAGEKRIIDIKTIYDPRKFEAMEKIAREMQEKKITLNEYLLRIAVQDKELARRLEGYISQVNFYLSKNIDALGELLMVSMQDPTREVKMEVGRFDPARFKRDISAVGSARNKIEGIISSISGETKKEEFVKGLPRTAGLESLRAAEKMAKDLTESEEKIYDRLSKEYLSAYESMGVPRKRRLWTLMGAGAAPPGGAGVPPTGMPPSGGGPGDDDEFERLRRKVEKIVGPGRKLEIDEALKLLDTVRQAEYEYLAAMRLGNTKLAEKYIELKQSIEAALQSSYEQGRSDIERLESVLKTPTRGMVGAAGGAGGYKPEEIEIPVGMKEPFITTEYLRAMLRRAIKFHDLFDMRGIEKFGPELEKLLEEALKKGPSIDIAGSIQDALKALPPEKKGLTAGIWKSYKKNVSEYFIKQLDELKRSIEESKSDDEARRAYDEYERTLQAFIGNIKRSLGKMSDIYTRPGFGGMREWVAPEFAKGAGIYRRPEEIAEIARQSAAMSGEFQPIMDMLIGDLDPMMLENMLTPLEKIRLAFSMLAREDVGLKSILKDADLFRRMGDKAVEAWDFDSLIKGVGQLRAGLQSWNRMQISGFGAAGGAEDYTEAQRKNIEDTIKYLKQLENMIGPVGGPKGSTLGMVQVPQFLDPREQELLHRRNIALARKHFKLAAEAGGPARGERFTYRQRIVDPASKQVLVDIREEFKKLGDAATDAGGKMGIFTQHTEDMIGAFQARKGVGQVFRRVIMWGGASVVVWGLVKALQNMMSTITDVEYGIAVLRQVMSPLETDFNAVTNAAVGFAKEFGQPIRSVIDSMRVFAQQGLAQAEVIERARTSQIAANVTTLTASDATEALTAAMKVYGREGASTLRFLDSWSQVEARHAITSKDLANSMKKAAAVAKTSGITFDELNAIVTGIGETSRQTGKEIGTSLRFMFRRIQAAKGPKALGEIGVPVIGPLGDLRRGFDILGDLASRWGELTNAQRLSIAQAIGGRRHYNSLIILMDHWDDALDTLEDSINSKGAAERRNAIVMETYAKKLQQVRAAIVGLQVQFGKLALPAAKTIVVGLKSILETIANIPNSMKIAALSIVSLFAVFSKGQRIIDTFVNRFGVLPNILKDFAETASKELKVGIFEIFGKLPKRLAIDTRGLKTIMEATNIHDLESILGKVGYEVAKFGQSWNSMLSDIAAGSVTASEAVGKLFGKFGGLLNLGGKALLGGGPWAAALGGIMETASVGAEGAETVFGKVAKAMGVPAEKLAEWTKGNTSFVKSVMPMVASLAALTPVAIKTWGSLKKLSLSAEKYEKSLAPIRRKVSGELQSLRDLSNEYGKLSRSIEKLNKIREPEAKEKAIRREEYKSPIFGMAEVYRKTQKFGNELAKSNFALVESFDEFGNAVLKTNRSLEEHIDLLTSAKRREAAKTEVEGLEKYVEDLTGGKGFTETLKYELKRFVKEIPAVGSLLAEHIAISPAKELDVLRNKMNEILALREKYPMTVAFEPMFEKYYKQLEDARAKFADTYRSFRRVLADIPTKGLKPIEIRDLLDVEELRKGFELMIRIEPKLQLKGIKGEIDWKDVLGAEILKRMYPEKPIDFAAPLTKELLLQSKLLKRSGKAFAGDIILFTEDVNKGFDYFLKAQRGSIEKIIESYKTTGIGGAGLIPWERIIPEKPVGKGFDIAGRQGVLKFKEGLGYFVEYVTKEMREVKEIPFSDVEKFVDAVFPTVTIQERLQDNLTVLTEFIAGAAAGMTGLTQQEFRRSFALGERFFAQIPTTTLLQTTKGWAPGAGYGEMGYKGAEIPRTFKTPAADLAKRWDAWMQTFWFEPQEKLRVLLEPAEKRGLADKGPGYGMAEDIQKLLDVLKNNQIVIQYRALHEDLIKTLNESNRVLEENIAIEKARAEYLVQTSGLLKGMPEDLNDINLGIRNFADLTAQQRILLRERVMRPEEGGLTGARVEYREARMRREERIRGVESIERARIQLREIQRTAVGLGAALPPEEMERMAESIAMAGSQPMGLMLNEEKKTASNTGRIVERMDDLLAQMGDPEAAARGQESRLKQIQEYTKRLKSEIDESSIGIGDRFSRAVDPLGAAQESFRRDLAKRFDYLVKLRAVYEKVGRKDLAKSIDISLTDLSNVLVKKLGFKQALEVFGRPTFFTPGEAGAEIGKYITKGFESPIMRLPGEFTKAEFIKRAVGDLGLREFVQVLNRYIERSDKHQEAVRKAVETYRVQLPGGAGVIPWERMLPPPTRERVLGSPEFKALEKEMSSQTTVSVNTSKNIQKLFAAYAGFQDVFRRASNREARYFNVQIKTLQDQRKAIVDQLKAGTVPKEEAKKSILGINKRIAEMAIERKEAITTAERRATQEAVGLIATAGISFARATGLSEGALKGLGETAAAAMVAWHAWSALTGEPIPEYIKKLGEEAKKAAKRLGKEAPGMAAKTWLWIEKVLGKGLGGAIKDVEEAAKKKKPIFTEEEKEKIRRMKDLQVNEASLKKADDMLKGIKKGDEQQLTTDKQILDENRQQTDILLGVYEALKMMHEARKEEAKKMDEQVKSTEGLRRIEDDQTSQTKKQTDYTKKESENVKAQLSYSKQLRDKIDAIKAERLRKGDIGTKIRDVLTTALLTATVGYVADAQAFGAELGEYEAKAKKMSGLVVKLVEKFPHEVEKAIEILREERAEREKALAKPGLTETERRSIIADQEKAYEEIGNRFKELALKLGEDAEAAGYIMSEAADKMYLFEAAQKIRMGLEALADATIEGVSNFLTDFKYNIETIGAMKGLPRFEELPIGKAAYDLTPTERLMKVGGEAWLNAYKVYKILSLHLTNTVNKIKEEEAKMMAESVSFIRSTEPSRKVVEEYGKRVEKLQNYGKQLVEQYKIGVKEGFKEPPKKFLEDFRLKMNLMYPKNLFEKFFPIERTKTAADEFYRNATIVNKKVAEGYKALTLPETMENVKKQLEVAVKHQKEIQRLYKAGYYEPPKKDMFQKLAEPSMFKAAWSGYKEMLHAITWQLFRPEKPVELDRHTKTLSKQNKRVVELTGQYSKLEAFGKKHPIADILVQLAEKEKELSEVQALQAIGVDNLTERMKKLRQEIKELGAYIAKGLAISSLMGQLEQLSNSLQISAKAAELNREAIDKLLGGPHPEAIQRPTVESIRGAAMMGIPPAERWTPNRWQMMEWTRAARGEPETPMSRYKVAQEKEIEVYVYRQREENRKLMEQIDKARGFRREIIAAQFAARSRGEPQVAEELESAFKRVTEIIENAAKVEEVGGKRYYRGIGEITEVYASFKEQIGKLGLEVKDITGPIVDVMKMADSDIVRAIEAGVLTLGSILTEKEFKKEDIEKYGGKFRELYFSFRKRSMDTIIKEASEARRREKEKRGGATGSFESGGRIVGPGGPKEDRVPIMSSSGEYVVKTGAAKQIGYGLLDYMNATGRLPGLQGGGRVYTETYLEPGTGTKRKLKALETYPGAKTHEVDGVNIIESGGMFSALHPKTRKLVTSPSITTMKEELGLIPKERYEPLQIKQYKRTTDEKDYNWSLLNLSRHHLEGLSRLKMNLDRGEIWGEGRDYYNKEFNIPKDKPVAYWDFLKKVYYGEGREHLFEDVKGRFLRKMQLSPLGMPDVITGRGLDIVSSYFLSKAGKKDLPSIEEMQRMYPHVSLFKHPAMQNYVPGFPVDFSDPSITYAKELSEIESKRMIEEAIKGMGLRPAGYRAGGSLKDNIPILASNGEYIFGSGAARSIGYGNLSHMNKTGQVPGFASRMGGLIQTFKKGGAVLEPLADETYEGMSSWWKDEAGAQMPKLDSRQMETFASQFITHIYEQSKSAQKKYNTLPDFVNQFPNIRKYITDPKTFYNYLVDMDEKYKDIKFLPDWDAFDMSAFIKPEAVFPEAKKKKKRIGDTFKEHFERREEYLKESTGGLIQAFQEGGKPRPTIGERLASIKDRILKAIFGETDPTAPGEVFSYKVLEKKMEKTFSERKKIMKELFGEDDAKPIPQYKEGISYVPRDQLAYLHKGEEVVPSGYQAGGQVAQLNVNVEEAVEKIEGAIEKAIKTNKLEVDFSGVTDDDKRMLPPREVPSLEIDAASVARLTGEIERALSNPITIEGVGAGGVGADEAASEIREVRELLENRLSVLEVAQIDSSTELSERINNIDISEFIKQDELDNRIRVARDDLERQISSSQTELDSKVETTKIETRLEKRLHEIEDAIRKDYGYLPSTVNRLEGDLRITVKELDVAIDDIHSMRGLIDIAPV